MSSLKDVAKEAGVAQVTVSRVLNGSENVRPKTRQKVEKAIKVLGYTRNRSARRLATKKGKSQMMGLLVPDIQNPFYVEVVRGVEEHALDNDYAVLMCNFAQDERRAKLYLNIMRSEGIDGLIAAPVNEWVKEITDLVNSGLPIVFIDRDLDGIETDSIVVNNEKGAFEAIELLIKLGHTRIGFIGGKPQIPTTLARLQGYESAIKEAGIDKDESLIKFGDSKHASGKKLADELLNLKNPPSALFTGNNLITLGALEAINTRGLNIPEDVAIVGFDDMFWSISLNPPLTAVSQPAHEIGRRAVEMLLQRIDKPDREPAKVVLNTKLMVRESCGSNVNK